MLLKVNIDGLPDEVPSNPFCPSTVEPVICVPKPGLGLSVLLVAPSCQLALMFVDVVTGEAKNLKALPRFVPFMLLSAGIKRSVVILPEPVIVPVNMSS